MRRIRPTAMFLVGLALLAGPTATVSAQSEAPLGPAPTAFTGRIAFGDCTSESTEIVEGISQTRGVVCDVPVLDMSDPRLDGDATLNVDIDDYPAGLHLYRWAFRIENDGGAWQQEPSLRVGYPDGSYSTATIILVGEGGYEGLIAVAEVPLTGDIWSLDGFVIDGEVPTFTE